MLSKALKLGSFSLFRGVTEMTMCSFLPYTTFPILWIKLAEKFKFFDTGTLGFSEKHKIKAGYIIWVDRGHFKPKYR